jgi:hypothetical protein
VASHRDLGSPVAWRRSLRASQARRAKQARRRRLALHGRASVTLAVALSTVAAGGAFAQDASTPAAPAAARGPDTVRALQQQLGVAVDGVYGPRTRSAVRRFQRSRGLAVDGVAGPLTLAALGVTAAASGDAAPGTVNGTVQAGGAGSGAPSPSGASPSGAPSSSGDASGTLARIAQCESGGDPTAVSADGTYRGKYQFDRATWQRLGGTGDPAAAPESEQDGRAAKLLAQRGTSPWPNCA